MASIDVAPHRRRETRAAATDRERAPLSGLAFVVLVVAAFVVGGSSPEGDASSREIVSYYHDNMDAQVISAVLAAFATPFAVIFGAAVRGALRGAPDAPRRWGDVALGGAVMAAVGILVAALLTFALADAADNDLPAGVLQTINTISASSWLMFVPGFGILGIGAGAALLQTGIVPRWVAWMALVLGIACFFPFTSFFAFLLSAVWIVAVALTLSATRAPGAASGQPA